MTTGNVPNHWHVIHLKHFITMQSIYYYPYFREETDSGRLWNLFKVTELVIRGASSQRWACDISVPELSTLYHNFVIFAPTKEPLLWPLLFQSSHVAQLISPYNNTFHGENEKICWGLLNPFCKKNCKWFSMNWFYHTYIWNAARGRLARVT